MSGEVKTIKLNERLSVSFKGSAKGYWYVSEIKLTYNPLNEDEWDYVVLSVQTAIKKWEDAGFVFIKPVPISKNDVVVEEPQRYND